MAELNVKRKYARRKDWGSVYKKREILCVQLGVSRESHIIHLGRPMIISTKTSCHSNGQIIAHSCSRSIRGNKYRPISICPDLGNFNPLQLHLPGKLVLNLSISFCFGKDSCSFGLSCQSCGLSLRSGFNPSPLCFRLSSGNDTVSFRVGLSVSCLSLDTSYRESALFLFDSVTVLSIDIGGFNLSLQSTS